MGLVGLVGLVGLLGLYGYPVPTPPLHVFSVLVDKDKIVEFLSFDVKG